MDVVFILDTSGSMGGPIQNLCNNMPSVVADLASRSININYKFLSIVPQRSVAVSQDCLSGNIASLLGTNVPGANPGMISALGITANREGGQSIEEDWGPAAAIVAARSFTNNGRSRLIVPLTDTYPCPLSIPNKESEYWISTSNAAAVAVLNNVVISPVILTNAYYLSAALPFATNIAQGTGGRVYAGVDTNTWRMVLNAVVAACEVSADCDRDGTPDECEPDCDHDGVPDDCDDDSCGSDCDADGIPDSLETDCDLNGIPDDCAIAMGRVKDDNCDGIPDSCQGDVAFRVVCSPHTSPHNFAIDSNCSARVYIPLQVTNGCPPVSLTSSVTSGVFTNGAFSHRYRVGQHVVEITATDARGRKASCSSTISVIDNTGPQLLNP